jgi:pimeloyl-ACP methyl ester carboxylesterase
MTKNVNTALDGLLAADDVVFVGHSLGGYVVEDHALRGARRACVKGLAPASPDGAKFSHEELAELHTVMHVGTSLRSRLPTIWFLYLSELQIWHSLD